MKLLLSLNDELPAKQLAEIPTINIQTSKISSEYRSLFYCDVGKYILFYKNYICDEKILGCIQNRRFFENLKNFSDDIFNDIDILLTFPFIFKIKMSMKEQFYNSLLLEAYENLKDNIEIYQYFIDAIKENYEEMIKLTLSEEEQNIFSTLDAGDAYFHNMFITKNDIFYKYAFYLDEKLNLLKNTNLYKMSLYNADFYSKNLKLGSWFAERLLTIFCKLNNYKIGIAPYIVLPKKQ